MPENLMRHILTSLTEKLKTEVVGFTNVAKLQLCSNNGPAVLKECVAALLG